MRVRRVGSEGEKVGSEGEKRRVTRKSGTASGYELLTQRNSC